MDAILLNISLTGRSKTLKVGIGPDCRSENVSFVTVKTRKCEGCGEATRETDFYKANICRSCAQAKGYSQKNGKMVGKKSRLPAFSLEFEVQHVQPDSDPDPVELVKHGFIACMDSSVQAEYKSPIFQDMVAFHHALQVMDSCKQFVGDRCGTHVHVEMQNKERLTNHYHEVFDLLEDWMKCHTKETVGFWGRYFTSYATDGNPINRYAWVNTSSLAQPTVEFRLSKFVDAEQFRALLMFVRRLVRYLDEQLAERCTSEDYTQISKTVLSLYQKAIEEQKESN